MKLRSSLRYGAAEANSSLRYGAAEANSDLEYKTILPYKVGEEIDKDHHNLNEYMELSDSPAFYVIKINLHRKILIKIGKTRNCGNRLKQYMRAYDGDKKLTVLRLIVFRKSNPDKSFEFDYKRMISFCDEFETQIIRKIKKLRYYNTVRLNSDEYYRSKDLNKINSAIDVLIDSIKLKVKERKLRKYHNT